MAAANVEVPAILLLEDRGYTLARRAPDLEQWSATRGDVELSGDSPLQLLGLASLAEARPSWQATDEQVHATLSRFGVERRGSGVITREHAERFADEWIAAWNAHDLDRVLAHYDDDFEMSSPKIVDIAGEPSGVLRGKANVGAYWRKALSLITDLRFEKIAVFVGAESVAVHYANQAGKLAVEVFFFGSSGRVARAAAHYA